MLTPRMRRALQVIVAYQRAHGGVSPACTDISDAMGISSKGRASEILRELESDGYIRRLPGRQRCIEVLKTSDGRIPIYRASDNKHMGFLP